jgi:hypothetical protein
MRTYKLDLGLVRIYCPSCGADFLEFTPSRLQGLLLPVANS